MVEFGWQAAAAVLPEAGQIFALAGLACWLACALLPKTRGRVSSETARRAAMATGLHHPREFPAVWR
jgi:hypothetical protein